MDGIDLITLDLETGPRVKVQKHGAKIFLCVKVLDHENTVTLSQVDARKLACALVSAQAQVRQGASLDARSVADAFRSWDAEPPNPPAIMLALQKYGRQNVLQAVEISGKAGKLEHFGYVLAVAKRLCEMRNKKNMEVAQVVRAALDKDANS